MPGFAPEMEYGLLKLTHFVHSEKLIQEGSRTLHNLGLEAIKIISDDTEGQLMAQFGSECIIYREELLDDPDALCALMREDNMNSSISMAEGTMAAYGTVDYVVTELLRQGNPAALTDEDIMKQVKSHLSDAKFHTEYLTILINFRSRLAPWQSEVFFWELEFINSLINSLVS